MDAPDGVRLPVITGEKGVFWCTLTVRGTPGHASQPLRTDNALVKAAEVVRRLAEYRPAADIHDAWRRFVEGIGLPPEIAERAARSRGHRRLLRRVPRPRSGPPGPCLHPHHDGSDRHAGRDQGERDPRPGTPRRGHPHPARLGPARGRGHARATPWATWPTTWRSTWNFTDPASTSPTDTPLWNALERVARRSYPDARCVPFLTVGATDARFFRKLGTVAYGFGLFSRRSDLRGLRHHVPRGGRAGGCGLSRSVGPAVGRCGPRQPRLSRP